MDLGNITDPPRLIGEINSLGDAIGTMIGDAPGLILAISSAAVQIGADDVRAVVAYLDGVVKAAEQLIAQLGTIVTDAGALTGDLLVLALWLGLVLAAVGWILTHLGFLFITVAGMVGLIDHVLDNERIIGLMKNFITGAMTAARAAAPGMIIDDWKARLAAGQRIPALYISGTNLTADRLMILALDEVKQLRAIADEGTWVLDLANQGQRTDSLFTPNPDIEDDLLALACMTSSSVPFVFPPIRWEIDRQSRTTGREERFSHVFVDGGVVDNTPIDLAVFADATHIVSIELTPLLDYNEVFETTDTSMDNLVGVAGRSFTSGMDGSLLRSISDVVDVNSQLRPSKRIRICRLAPVIPKSANATNGDTVGTSPGLVDFDGVYNAHHHVVMSLFDWFIQGYVDAKGWAPADASGAAASDPVFQAFMAAAPADAGFIKQPVFSGNKFWSVEDSALPLPIDAQGIAAPDRPSLADAAEQR